MSEINWEYLSNIPDNNPTFYVYLKTSILGYNYKEIAHMNGVAHTTVKNAFTRVMHKVGATGQAQLVHLAHQVKIL